MDTIAIPMWVFGLMGAMITICIIPFVLYVLSNINKSNLELALLKAGHSNLIEKLTSLAEGVKDLAEKFEEYIEEDRKLMKEAMRRQ